MAEEPIELPDYADGNSRRSVDGDRERSLRRCLRRLRSGEGILAASKPADHETRRAVLRDDGCAKVQNRLKGCPVRSCEAGSNPRPQEVLVTRLVQHPTDPTVFMLVEVDHPTPLSIGQVVTARTSKVGVDLQGDGLAFYRKADTAYGVGWMLLPCPHVCTTPIPLWFWEMAAKRAA